MKEGYYWATRIETGKRQIIEIELDRVFITGCETDFAITDFKDFVWIMKT